MKKKALIVWHEECEYSTILYAVYDTDFNELHSGVYYVEDLVDDSLLYASKDVECGLIPIVDSILSHEYELVISEL